MKNRRKARVGPHRMLCHDRSDHARNLPFPRTLPRSLTMMASDSVSFSSRMPAADGACPTFPCGVEAGRSLRKRKKTLPSQHQKKMGEEIWHFSARADRRREKNCFLVSLDHRPSCAFRLFDVRPRKPPSGHWPAIWLKGGGRSCRKKKNVPVPYGPPWCRAASSPPPPAERST